MTRGRYVILLAGLPVAALAVAGCSSGGGTKSASGTGATNATTPAPATTGGQPATVSVADNKLGDLLVDAQGRTLYLFGSDTGTTSTCTGACASAWPPLRSSAPTAGTQVNGSLLGTTPRSDGDPQVTYHGHPLYTFVKDTKAGDTNGEGVTAFGASWFVVSPAGAQISPAAASSGGSGY